MTTTKQDECPHYISRNGRCQSCGLSWAEQVQQDPDRTPERAGDDWRRGFETGHAAGRVAGRVEMQKELQGWRRRCHLAEQEVMQLRRTIGKMAEAQQPPEPRSNPARETREPTPRWMRRLLGIES